jgi:DNA repair protein RadC
MNKGEILPRKKIRHHGVQSLTDVELIATLLNTGSKNQTVFAVAQSVLCKSEDGIIGLSKLSIHEISSIPGIGESKATAIIAAMELGRRIKESITPSRTKIRSSKDCYDQFSFMGDLPHEEFWILLLRRNNTVIDKVQISKGGIAGTYVDTRIILKRAIESLASGIVLCHNHPSGELTPSQQDIQITNRLKQAASTMEIQIIDHIIIGGKSHYSFNDNTNI